MFGNIAIAIQDFCCPCSTVFGGYDDSRWEHRRVGSLQPSQVADAGYQSIAPDYCGAHGSSKPLGTFTKHVMAHDLHTLVTRELGIRSKTLVVGHDIGGMIAHANAVLFLGDLVSV